MADDTGSTSLVGDSNSTAIDSCQPRTAVVLKFFVLLRKCEWSLVNRWMHATKS
jgi:hypothetical protein